MSSEVKRGKKLSLQWGILKLHMKKILLIYFLVLSQLSFCQYCALPTTIKSTSLYYVQLPFSVDDIATPNYRFFYKIIIECGGNPSADMDQLHISNPNTPTGGAIGYAWIPDSSRIVTGQLDPCIALAIPPCYSINYYHADIIQPDITKPFKATTTNCCRVSNTVNVWTNNNDFHYGPPPPPPPI